MSEPIPAPVRITFGSQLMRGRHEMALAVICPNGWPYSRSDRLSVIEEARKLANESLTRRRIPTPFSGWRMGLLHPDEPWQDHLSPGMVARITADLTEHPESTAVAVVVIYGPEGGRQWTGR